MPYLMENNSFVVLEYTKTDLGSSFTNNPELTCTVGESWLDIQYAKHNWIHNHNMR